MDGPAGDLLQLRLRRGSSDMDLAAMVGFQLTEQLGLFGGSTPTVTPTRTGDPQPGALSATQDAATGRVATEATVSIHGATPTASQTSSPLGSSSGSFAPHHHDLNARPCSSSSSSSGHYHHQPRSPELQPGASAAGSASVQLPPFLSSLSPSFYPSYSSPSPPSGTPSFPLPLNHTGSTAHDGRRSSRSQGGDRHSGNGHRAHHRAAEQQQHSALRGSAPSTVHTAAGASSSSAGAGAMHPHPHAAAATTSSYLQQQQRHRRHSRSLSGGSNGLGGAEGAGYLPPPAHAHGHSAAAVPHDDPVGAQYNHHHHHRHHYGPSSGGDDGAGIFKIAPGGAGTPREAALFPPTAAAITTTTTTTSRVRMTGRSEFSRHDSVLDVDGGSSSRSAPGAGDHNGAAGDATPRPLPECSGPPSSSSSSSRLHVASSSYVEEHQRQLDAARQAVRAAQEQLQWLEQQEQEGVERLPPIPHPPRGMEEHGDGWHGRGEGTFGALLTPRLLSVGSQTPLSSASFATSSSSGASRGGSVVGSGGACCSDHCHHHGSGSRGGSSGEPSPRGAAELGGTTCTSAMSHNHHHHHHRPSTSASAGFPPGASGGASMHSGHGGRRGGGDDGGGGEGAVLPPDGGQGVHTAAAGGWRHDWSLGYGVGEHEERGDADQWRPPESSAPFPSSLPLAPLGTGATAGLSRRTPTPPDAHHRPPAHASSPPSHASIFRHGSRVAHGGSHYLPTRHHHYHQHGAGVAAAAAGERQGGSGPSCSSSISSYSAPSGREWGRPVDAASGHGFGGHASSSSHPSPPPHHFGPVRLGRGGAVGSPPPLDHHQHEYCHRPDAHQQQQRHGSTPPHVGGGGGVGSGSGGGGRDGGGAATMPSSYNLYPASPSTSSDQGGGADSVGLGHGFSPARTISTSSTSSAGSHATGNVHSTGWYVPLHPEDVSKNLSSMRCRSCGQFGHVMRYCHAVVCFTCRQPGHMASVCPYAPQATHPLAQQQQHGGGGVQLPGPAAGAAAQPGSVQGQGDGVNPHALQRPFPVPRYALHDPQVQPQQQQQPHRGYNSRGQQ